MKLVAEKKGCKGSDAWGREALEKHQQKQRATPRAVK